MFSPDRLHTIKIEWSYPREYDNQLTGIENHPLANNKGIYCISINTRKGEEIIYIGKTIRPFSQRLKEHVSGQSMWLKERVESFKIRLCCINETKFEKFEHIDKLIEDIESALVLAVNPKWNIDKTCSYHYTYDLRIINTRCFGKLPKEVVNREQ